MAISLDVSELSWQQGTFRDYSLPVGTALYENVNSSNQTRVISSPVTVGGAKCVVKVGAGWLAQCYGLDGDMNYLGAGRFFPAAQTVTCEYPDVEFLAVCLRTSGSSNISTADVASAGLSVSFPDAAGGGAPMSNPFQCGFDKSELWVKNGSFNSSCAAGASLASVNSGNGSGNRIALAALAEIPADTFEVSLASGYQMAACAFDEDGKYLGNSTGYVGFCPWNSATRRTLTRPSGARYWCVYLRVGSGSTALEPADVAGAQLVVSFDAGGGCRFDDIQHEPPARDELDGGSALIHGDGQHRELRRVEARDERQGRAPGGRPREGVVWRIVVRQVRPVPGRRRRGRLGHGAVNGPRCGAPAARSRWQGGELACGSEPGQVWRARRPQVQHGHDDGRESLPIRQRLRERRELREQDQARVRRRGDRVDALALRRGGDGHD